jgi:hypothetical protein
MVVARTNTLPQNENEISYLLRSLLPELFTQRLSSNFENELKSNNDYKPLRHDGKAILRFGHGVSVGRKPLQSGDVTILAILSQKKKRLSARGSVSLSLGSPLPRSPTKPISTHFIRAQFISNIDHQGMHLVSPNIRLCFFCFAALPC